MIYVRRFFLYFLIPLSIYVAIPRASLDGPIEFLDEGIRLQPAAEYLLGKKPYRDIFFVYGPGIQLAEPLLAFKLFGDSLIAHRKLEYLIDALPLLSFFFLTLMIVRNEVVLIYLLYMVLGWQANLLFPRGVFLITSLALFYAGLESQRKIIGRILFAAAGTACMLSFLYTIESGLIGLGIFGSFMSIGLLRRLKSTILLRDWIIKGFSFFGGICLVALPFFLWLLKEGLVGLFFSDLAMIRSGFAELLGKPCPPLTENLMAFIRHPAALFFWSGTWHRWWLPIFLSVGFLAYYLSRFKEEETKSDRTILFLALCGIFFFRIAMGRSDYDHWSKGTIPFWVTLVFLADVCVERLKTGNWIKRAAWLIALVLLVRLGSFLRRPVYWKAISQNIAQLRSIVHPSPLLGEGRMVGISLDNDRNKMAGDIDRAIRKYAPKNSSVFLFGPLDVFYYLSCVSDPTRRDYGLKRDDNIAVTIAQLKAAGTKLVVLESVSRRRYEHYPYQEELLQYILSCYSPVEKIGPYTFFVPNEKFKKEKL